MAGTRLRRQGEGEGRPAVFRPPVKDCVTGRTPDTVFYTRLALPVRGLSSWGLACGRGFLFSPLSLCVCCVPSWGSLLMCQVGITLF